jgi:hypothetical protein
MHMGRQRRREAVKEGLHGGRTNLGEYESEGQVGAGSNRADDPGGRVALVDPAPGADAALEPDADTATFLADPGLVLAPELDLSIRVIAGDPTQGGSEASSFKRSCAALSALGWCGRVFC